MGGSRGTALVHSERGIQSRKMMRRDAFKGKQAATSFIIFSMAYLDFVSGRLRPQIDGKGCSDFHAFLLSCIESGSEMRFIVTRLLCIITTTQYFYFASQNTDSMQQSQQYVLCCFPLPNNHFFLLQDHELCFDEG